MWIERTFEPYFEKVDSLGPFSVWLLLGPRQVGKSSLLRRFSGRSYVSLDDLDTRRLANQDPQLFMRSVSLPCLIDEIQYAPELLSPIKSISDSGIPHGSIWLTGSQNFEVMRGVRESLAGRVVILNLLGLSDEEKKLSTRSQLELSPSEYFRSLHGTTFPKLFVEGNSSSRELYLSSYQQTYLERDVQELIGIQKRREFEIFLKMCALRTAQMVNLSELARDSGISPGTAKEWLSVLEDSFILKLIYPYFNNRTKRMVKQPKLYFLDAGLAAHIGGWRDSESARLGPVGGALLETHIFGEILRYYKHRAKDCEINFLRTRDKEEIDFLVDDGRKIIPIEVKLGQPSNRDLLDLTKFSDQRWKFGSIVALSQLGKPATPITNNWTLRSPLELTEILSS